MKNTLSIRCRFCPTRVDAKDKGTLGDRYARHLRNCGAMKRVCVERKMPERFAIADTLKAFWTDFTGRPGIDAISPALGGYDVQWRRPEALDWCGPPLTPDENSAALGRELLRPNPMLEAVKR